MGHQHGWYTSNPTCILAIERERDSNGLHVANCCQSTISKVTDLDGECTFCRNESQKKNKKHLFGFALRRLSSGGDFEKYIYGKKKTGRTDIVVFRARNVYIYFYFLPEKCWNHTENKFIPASPDATSLTPGRTDRYHHPCGGCRGVYTKPAFSPKPHPKPHFFRKRSSGGFFGNRCLPGFL